MNLFTKLIQTPLAFKALLQWKQSLTAAETITSENETILMNTHSSSNHLPDKIFSVSKNNF